MSFFGNLLKIIAIGAFFIATGPFGLSIGSTLATALRISGVVLSYLGALIDRPHLLQARQQEMVRMALDPNTPIPVVYGRAKVGAIVTDWFLQPSNNKKELYVITTFCHGSRDGLGVAGADEIWLDQAKAINVVANTYYYPPYTKPTAEYKVFLGTTVQNVGGTAFFTGGSGSGLQAPGSVTNSGWSLTSDTGKGLCVIGFVFVNVDTNAAVGGGVGPVFHGPPSIAAIVRGNRIYDSRTDTWTAGGDNPALCVRDYLLAPIYGCGFSASLIHEQSFKDAADYCDTLVKHVVTAPVTVTSSSVANPSVITATAHGFGTSGTFMVRIAGHTGSTPSINGDYTATYVSANSFSIPVNVTVGGTGGTVVKLVQIKRHTCNGVLDTARTTSDNLQELLSSCRGNLVWEQGQFKLTIRSEIVASPTITLSPANIIGQWSFRNAGLEEKWNAVTATYIEPANGEFKTQDVQWPLVGTTNSYLTSDGNFTNSLQLSLPFTNDQLMAQMIAQVTLNEARLGITCSVRCTEEALAASVGDRVYVTHPTPGWTLKQFWVTALQIMPDTTVAVSLQEYDSTAYDLGTMEDRRSFPATTLDSVFTVPTPGAVTSVSLAGGGMKISWVSAAYGLIDYYEVQARLTSAGEDYVTIERVRENSVLQAVAPLARVGQAWDARVRVVNVVGWPSAWVDAPLLSIPIPGAVTPATGQLIWTGFAPTITIVPASPTLNSVGRSQSGGDLCAYTGNWIQTPSWNVTNPNDTYFQINIEVATDAGATNWTSLVTGLTTVTGSYDNDTGVSVKTVSAGSGSPNGTFYREYRIKLVRKSDSAVITSLDTTQGTLVRYSGFCGPEF